MYINGKNNLVPSSFFSYIYSNSLIKKKIVNLIFSIIKICCFFNLLNKNVFLFDLLIF